MQPAKESLLSWRRLCFLLIALLIIIYFFNAFPNSITRTDAIKFQDTTSKQDRLSRNFGIATADNEAVDGLTDPECDRIFPDLYYEVDRAVSYWKQRSHTISPADVTISKDDAAMRILIHENEVRILESYHSVNRTMASPDRALGVLYLIQRALDSALAAGETLPTVEIALNFQDDADPPASESDTHSFWTFARTTAKEAHQRLWLMPNFDFWYYGPTGSFADAKRGAMQHDAPFASKIPKVVWRGNPTFNPDLRGGLIESTKGKDWADVAAVQFNEDPPVYMDVDQFCTYAMTVYTEGVTYSGRLKFLMNCASLLIIHDVEYATHYSHLLVKDGPEQNFVPVKRDWSDLEDSVRYYLERPDEAERIIANSLKTFRSRYTTRAATSCYIRRLITGYGSVSHTPEVNVPTKDGKGVKRRGYSFEKFMDTPQDIDFEHLD